MKLKLNNSIILLIIITSIILITGCSKTSVKYQCTDGTFMDTPDACSSKTSIETICPKLDCTICPAKIEYKDREVEKIVNVDKLKYQYQCLDGTFKDTIELCSNIQQIIQTLSQKVSTDICSDSVNKNLQKIDVTTEADRKKTGDTILKTQIKWYPSLNEGWVEMYFLEFKNSGCTIINREKISFTISVYDAGQIIYTATRQNEGFSYFYMGDDSMMGNRKLYPQDEDTMRIPFNIKTTGGMLGWEYFKFTKSGNYPVKFDIYYDSKLIAHVEDVISIQ